MAISYPTILFIFTCSHFEIWVRSDGFFIENFEISLKLLILPPDLSSKYQFSDRKCPQIPSKWFENITIINVEVSMYHLKRFGVVQMDFVYWKFRNFLEITGFTPGFGPKRAKYGSLFDKNAPNGFQLFQIDPN